MKYSLSVVTIAFLCTSLTMAMNNKKLIKSLSWSNMTAKERSKNVNKPYQINVPFTLNETKNVMLEHYKEKANTPTPPIRDGSSEDSQYSDESAYNSEELREISEIIKHDPKTYDDK